MVLREVIDRHNLRDWQRLRGRPRRTWWARAAATQSRHESERTAQDRSNFQVRTPTRLCSAKDAPLDDNDWITRSLVLQCVVGRE